MRPGRRFTLCMPAPQNHECGVQSRSGISAAHPGNPAYDNKLNGMRGHILRRLREHLQKDFLEYNARPYTRYTWPAIQNLYDYAEDDAVRTAAQSVLDYWSARAAVYTNDGRANPPYRRRVSHNRSDLFHAEADRIKSGSCCTQLLHLPLTSCWFPLESSSSR